MMLRPPQKLIVAAEVAQSPLLAALCQRLPKVPITVVDHLEEAQPADPTVLEVVSHRGRFIKNCPGTRHYLCCGYQILHTGIQCSLDCSYCILQAYLNQPNLRVFGNTQDLLKELEAHLAEYPNQLHRFGTGEFTDSLLLDPWTALSRQLVPFFSQQPKAILELKTKTNFIENLEGIQHGGHTIVAWSLNAAPIQKREEPRSATIDQRLAAAQKCAAWGYSLAFHFDPLIEHPDWEANYRATVTQLFERIDPARIVWISLGAFRFMPDLKPIVVERHPKSRILYGEFIRGLDGKMRYFRDIRVEMYRAMIDAIRRADPTLCVYLCMESEDIWRDAMGYAPREHGGLSSMLDAAVKRRMGIG